MAPRLKKESLFINCQLNLHLHYITSHGCQGQTIPKLLADLHTGGFSAHVQASRPTNRQGLCLIEPITLSDLNHYQPILCKKETAQLKALEHNSLICYGFKTGQSKQVPDAESEHQIIPNPLPSMC